LIETMNDAQILVAAAILMAPFGLLIIAANLRRSNERHLRKLKERADKKTKTNIR